MAFYWDPDPVAFTIPVIEHPVTWYGVLFAIGFLLAYQLFLPIARFYSKLDDVRGLADTLLWITIVAAVVGARLGAVFLYDWGYYSQHPWEIVMTWRGGLSSHGGAVAVILGVCFYRWWIKEQAPAFTLARIYDSLAIPTCVLGACVRTGNFINQEIIGTPSDVPWAITFGHPADGSAPVPRHPAQLYEGAWYLIMLVGLWFYWKRCRDCIGPGKLAGLFLVLLFSFRIFVEFWKPHQSDLISTDATLWMGQLLSIPFVVGGLVVLFWPSRGMPPK